MLDWTIVVPRHAMSAFLKTLFGDPGTVAIGAIVMTFETLLVAGGRVSWAAYALASCALARTAWLVTS